MKLSVQQKLQLFEILTATLDSRWAANPKDTKFGNMNYDERVTLHKFIRRLQASEEFRIDPMHELILYEVLISTIEVPYTENVFGRWNTDMRKLKYEEILKQQGSEIK